MPSTPNLVFIFPDQYRQQAVRCMGGDPVLTPNLDRLGGEGMVLTRAVSNYPVCSPYRAMLMTGQYPFTNGVYKNCNSRTAPMELAADARCFPDVLAEAGYACGYVGKWHLDAPNHDHVPYTEGYRGDGTLWDTYTPPARRHGFGFWHAYGCCDRHVDPHYWVGDAAVDERIEPGEWSVKHEADVAAEFIADPAGRHRDPDAPFALFVAFNPPHTPFDQVPPQYLRPYADATAEELLSRPNVSPEGRGEVALEHVKNYFAAVTGIDEQIGRILHALDAAGLRDETVVVFTADHGEMMGSHGLMHKNVWYDESLLVPFLVRWPGRVPAGQDDALLSVPDVMPSLLSLMGLGDRVPAGVEGRDLSGVFRGESADRPGSALYLNCLRIDPMQGNRGLRTPERTFVLRRTDAGEEVFLHDNAADPYQLENVAADRPGEVETLRRELWGWLERTGDPWATGEPPAPAANDEPAV